VPASSFTPARFNRAARAWVSHAGRWLIPTALGHYAQSHCDTPASFATARGAGTHVQQAGSLVAPDRLRFDFTHSAMLTQDELDTVIENVNDLIISNYPVNIHYENYKDAVGSGARRSWRKVWRCRARHPHRVAR